MASQYSRLSNANTQLPPIVTELEAVFKEIPDEELLTKLKGPRRRGPKGYDPKILWRCYVAYYYLALPSVSDLIRTLFDNPYIASVCCIKAPESIPSQPTFSRFLAKLSKQPFRADIKRVMAALTQRLYDTLPDFGKSVSMDATDLKAWSNGAHRTPTDKDAGWVIKGDTNGRGKFTWGYKLSLAVDTQHELPLAMKLTSGNVHETQAVSAMLRQARRINSKFHPEYIIADSGYCSEPIRKLIRRQYRAEPIVKVNPSHRRSLQRYPETPDWQLIYNRRTSSERVFARLKLHRRLNSIRVRGIWKVTVHCLMAILVLQAQALATGCRASVRKVA